MHKSQQKWKIYNMSEHMKIMNCLKKYEREDSNLLNKIFEFLSSVEELPQGTTIYKIVSEAENFTTEQKFKKPVQKNKEQNKEPLDLMKYL